MKLRITSIPNLIVFMKKLKSVEKSVILEISEDKIFGKVHTPDRAVMKYSAVDLPEVLEGDVDWTALKCDRIKIGINDITRLIEAFKHFRPEEEVFLEIKTSEFDDSCVATEVRLVSSSLNIRIRCADLDGLSYVEDKILSLVHSKEDSVCRFKMYQSDFTTLLSLCGMENDAEEILKFEIDSKSVHGSGNSFRYKLNMVSSEIEGSDTLEIVNVYKNQLGYMESETCSVYVHDNRIVMISDQSQTSIAIGMVVK